MQRDLERARHLENIDLRTRDVAGLDLGEEGDAAFRHHVAVPRGLHEGDALRFCETRMRWRRRRVDGFGSLHAGGAGVRLFDNGVLGFGVFSLGVFGFGVLRHLIHGVPRSGPESGHTEQQRPRGTA
jgi:hypothetical protein